MTRFLSGTFRVFLGFCLVLTLSLVVGCKLDDDDDDSPTLGLNPDLIGTWFADFGGGYTDTYTITATTVSHPEAFTGAYANAEIVYVYNFNEAKTAGGLIIKRKEDAVKDKPYNAVFFKDLSKKNQVLLGDANDTTKDYRIESTDASVATLEEAKQRFGPANAPIYGGGSAQGGTPQAWQP